MTKRLSYSLLAASFCGLAACAPVSGGNPTELAGKTGDTIGCTTFKDTLFDEIYAFPLSEQRFPSEQQLREALQEKFSNGRFASVSEADRQGLIDRVVAYYQILIEDAPRTLSIDADQSQDVLHTLAAIELGDRTTEEKSRVQDKLAAAMADIQEYASNVEGLSASCLTPPPSGGSTPGESTPDGPTPGTAPGATDPSKPATTLFSHWKATRHPAVYGGLKTLAVSYQSCTAGTLPALNSTTPNVQGIRIVGTHADGIGSKREISDLAALLRTHPYLSDYQKPNSSCFDIKSKPLIYDYGGRPVTTSATTSTFDFFKNAGSGTAVLGTDCSGYVYMALAAAGLKVKADGRLKAITVHGITSRMLLNPAGNGLTCLNHAKFSPTDGTLKPGDIIVKAGHVFMVDAVGADPFGVKNIASVAQCTTANMSISRFDFTILQSSPSKNGIGIHRVKAADYLKESSAMATGLLSHAAAACKARFGQTVTKPSTTVVVIRHSGSASCKDVQIGFEKESCVSSCPASLATQSASEVAMSSAY